MQFCFPLQKLVELQLKKGRLLPLSLKTELFIR